MTLERGLLLTATDRRVFTPSQTSHGLVQREINQCHRTLTTRPLHERAATADHAHRLIEVEDAGDVSCSDFSHAMADDRSWLDAERTPEAPRRRSR